MSESLNSSSGESSTDTSTDSSESKPSKKKSTAVTTTLGGLTAERALTAEAPKKEEPKRETIWEQIGRIADEPQKKEAPLSGERSPAADTAPDRRQESQDGAVLSDKETMQPDGANAEAQQAAEKDPEHEQLGSLSPEEAQETVRQYAEARFDTVQSELHDLPPESSEAAAAAADAAFLAEVQQRMAEYPDRPVDEAMEAAETHVIRQMDAEVPPEVQEAHGRVSEAGAPELPYAPSAEAETPGAYAPPAAESGGGGSTVPPEAAAAMRGGGGDRMPPAGPVAYGFGGGGEYRPTVPLPAPSLETATVAMVPASEALSNERSAAAGGLLVGGVVGYLMGRRKGRIKTERKIAPVQKKLEREVKTLHEAVAIKEHQIRTQAAEKVQLVQQQDRQQFTEKLRAAAVITPKAAEQIPPQQQTEAARVAEMPQQRTAELPAYERRDTVPVKERAMQQPERFGRLAVEAPLAAAVLAGKSAEQLARTPAVKVGKKKIEQFTPAEVDKAAQSIKFEGITLKELKDSKRLDERGVRRVLAEHLRGGNINEILAKELLEKELSFERDPRMRAQIASHLAGGGSHVAAAAAVIASWNDPSRDQAAVFEAAAQQRQQADDAERASKKRQQTATAAGGTIVLIAIGFLLVLLLA